MTAAPASETPPGRLAGRLEHAGADGIAGWAIDLDHPAVPVCLTVLIDDEPVASLRADRPRGDLRAAGFGNGDIGGFRLSLPVGLQASCEHAVAVRRTEDGAELPASPVRMGRETVFSPAVRASLADAITTAAGSDDAIHRVAQAAVALVPPDAPAPQLAFRARWTGSTFAAPPGRHALFIDDRAPDPTRDAGSNALLSHMRSLRRLGFQVGFAAACSAGDETSEAPIAALAAEGITCWHAPWTGSVEEVLRRAGAWLDVVYLHRHANMARYGALVRTWCPRARLVYAVADLHFLRQSRQAEIEPHPAAQALSQAATRQRADELHAAQSADAVITHSSAEAALLAAHIQPERLHRIAWEVPPRPTRIGLPERRGVAFVGSYDHPPNLDAALWLVRDIMPLVHRRDPGIDCLLAGSLMPGALYRLQRPGIIPLGHIAELADLWNRVRLSVAPLRYGAGLKGKVLDSLAAGIPCVCTPLAAEGMALPPPLAGLVSDTPPALAEAIVRLHEDASLNAAAAAAGLDWIAAGFTPERIDTALARVCAGD